MQQFFKVPNQELRKVAIGSLPGLPYRVRKALEQVIPMFSPIDKPKAGDWLWDHQQQGQTFAAYQGQMHNIIDQKRNVIYIKPLQEQIDKNFLDLLDKYCRAFFYPLEIKFAQYTNVLKKVSSRINEYTEKAQVNAKEILQQLKKSLKPDAFCLIGVTITDLYPRDQWNFVFGTANLKDRTGVFSLARYDPKFFTQQKFDIDYDRILWRSLGVMTHQITHMFGVRHCIYFNCLMNGSNHQQESSKKPLELCPVCLRKMQSNIKFDILTRYKMIQEFIEKYVSEDKRIKNHREFINTIIRNIKDNIKEK